MHTAQGGDIMEKQPNSRMCFVCGIDNPIGLHVHFYTDDQVHCVNPFREPAIDAAQQLAAPLPI